MVKSIQEGLILDKAVYWKDPVILKRDPEDSQPHPEDVRIYPKLRFGYQLMGVLAGDSQLSPHELRIAIEMERDELNEQSHQADERVVLDGDEADQEVKGLIYARKTLRALSKEIAVDTPETKNALFQNVLDQTHFRLALSRARLKALESQTRKLLVKYSHPLAQESIKKALAFTLYEEEPSLDFDEDIIINGLKQDKQIREQAADDSDFLHPERVAEAKRVLRQIKTLREYFNRIVITYGLDLARADEASNDLENVFDFDDNDD